MNIAAGLLLALMAAPANDTELTSRIRTVLEETNTPGMIGVLVDANGTRWRGALGLADVESGHPVARGTLFRIGSISKSLVGIAALMTAERGLIDLEAPVAERVPAVGIENPWADTSPVRLVHLLEHTAGFDDIHMRDFALSDPDIALLDGIRYNTTSRQVRWRPGTRMSYSNMGPAVAALVIRKATGESFETFVEDEVFTPLGMDSATFRHDPRIAASYRADGETPIPFSHITVRPAGSVSAGIDDMAPLVRMLLNRGRYDGGRLLPAAAIERMETPTSTLAAKAGHPYGYGLGNYTFELEDFLFHGHDGGIDGFLASYGYLPEAGRGFFFSINAANGEAFERIRGLLVRYLTRDLEPDAPAPAVTAVDLSPYTGYYRSATPRRESLRAVTDLSVIRISAGDGVLRLGGIVGPQQTLVPTGTWQFRFEDEHFPSIAFVRDAGGTMLAQGGVTRGTLAPISAVHAWTQTVLMLAVALAVVSTLLYALWWIPRRLLGRGSATPARWLPLAAVGSLVAWIAILAAAVATDPIGRLGHPTVWSGSVFVLNVAFCVFTVWGALRLAGRLGPVPATVRCHAVIVMGLMVVTLLYLGFHGWIAIRTWA